jgi:hypothetical protein
VTVVEQTFKSKSPSIPKTATGLDAQIQAILERIRTLKLSLTVLNAASTTAAYQSAIATSRRSLIDFRA